VAVGVAALLSQCQAAKRLLKEQRFSSVIKEKMTKCDCGTG
jgi:hypothetical protein